MNNLCKIVRYAEATTQKPFENCIRRMANTDRMTIAIFDYINGPHPKPYPFHTHVYNFYNSIILKHLM